MRKIKWPHLENAMETKSKRIRLIKADDYVALNEAFGWSLVSKDELRPDETILVTMQRDRELFSNYSEIRRLEKDYYAIKRPYPLLAIIFAAIGGVLLPFYFIFKGLIVAIVCLYASLTFFLIALFALFIFIIVLCRRKKLLSKIMEFASNKSGANKEWPTDRNIAPEEEDTWTIRSQIG